MSSNDYNAMKKMLKNLQEVGLEFDSGGMLESTFRLMVKLEETELKLKRALSPLRRIAKGYLMSGTVIDSEVCDFAKRALEKVGEDETLQD